MACARSWAFRNFNWAKDHHKTCLEPAWAAYRAGSRPIGAVVPVFGSAGWRQTERLEEFLECKLRCGYVRQPAQQYEQEMDGAIIVEVERPRRVCAIGRFSKTPRGSSLSITLWRLSESSENPAVMLIMCRSVMRLSVVCSGKRSVSR